MLVIRLRCIRPTVELAARFLAAGNAAVSSVMPEDVRLNGDVDVLAGTEKSDFSQLHLHKQNDS